MNTTLTMILRNLKTELDRISKENESLKNQLHTCQQIMTEHREGAKNDPKS
jgi:hypothetical protein